MKKSVLIFFIFVSLVTYGQNKTLGVGTSTVNPNAALHVESPTNNQGFIMPRLTTAQRTGMGSLLIASDNGLMLYDTDLKTIYIWDGASWKSTAQVAGGTKLAYPYKDSVTTNPGTTDLFALKYAGTDNARVMRIENQNATNGSSTVSVLNTGTGLAGYFQVSNPTSGGTALYGTTNSNLGGTVAPVGVYGQSTGTGSLGGAFWNTNAANTWPALYSRTLGVGNAARFEILNTGNAAPALVAETNGTGNAIQTSGKIQAGQFIGSGSTTGRNFSGKSVTRTTGTDTLSYVEVNNPASIYPAVLAISNSDGGAGAFIASNPTTGAAGLYVEAQGSGPALDVYTTGNGNVAGRFTVDNVSSNGSIIQATTVGTGPGIELSLNTASAFPGILINKAGGIGNAIEANRPIQATQFIGDGSGLTNLPAVSFPFSTSLNNASTLFDITNTGIGKAGNFSINNAANTSPALNIETNGLSYGIRSYTTGAENAGYFETNNLTNTNSTIAALNNSNTGNALYAGTTGGGRAAFFDIFNTANTSNVITVQTNGLGTGGNFKIINAANTGYALVGETNGAALSAGVFGNNTGTGFGVFGKANGTAFGSAAVYGEQTGTGDAGGAFRIINSSNTYSGLYGETNGSGAAVYGYQLGTGRAGLFQVNNAVNSAEAFRATTNGTGTAGRFIVNNPASAANVIVATTTGTGTVIRADHNGITGYAGVFQNINVANNNPSLFASTASNGPAFRADTDMGGNAIEGAVFGTGSGKAGDFVIDNATNSSPALSSETNGTGAAISANNNGTGFGIYARALGATDAIYAVKEATDGTGSAGNFWNNNSGNAAATLFSATNAGGSAALGLMNSAGGNALAIFSGGLKFSVVTVSAGGAITQLAGVYHVTTNASVTLPAATDGQVCWVFNGSGGVMDLTDAGLIEPTAGKFAQFIYIGQWRPME